MRTAKPIVLNEAERETLQHWAESLGRLSQRARIVLLASDGLQNIDIALQLKADPHTVSRWRARFTSKRLAGIKQEAPRSGRSRDVRESVAAEVLRHTSRGGNKQKRLSSRALAKKLNINHMLVYRVWKDHGLIENSDLN